MRYAYHGKVRQSGLRVDGHIEAAHSVEAIDLLADKGIIGVYTVRPDPLPEVAKPKVLPAPEGLPSTADAALGQIVEKLSTLIGQVEKLLTRPVQISGPIREGGGGGGRRLTRPVTNDNQNSALRDIFQSNLDLRRSLAKLTSAAAALRESESAPLQSAATPSSDDEDGAARDEDIPQLALSGVAQPAA